MTNETMKTGTSLASRSDPDPGAAYTKTELLVTIATSTVLAALVIAPLAVVRAQSRLKVCTGNLLQVGRAALLFAEDHGTGLPGLIHTESGDPWWWYKEEIKSYIGLSAPSSPNDQVFACPLDRGYSDSLPFCKSPRFDYGSYVFNGVTLFGTPNIAGWKLPAVNQPGRTLLVMEWPAHAPYPGTEAKPAKQMRHSTAMPKASSRLLMAA